jgi:DNA-directed RNA polymerase specialized sigma24 family protein
MQRTIGLDPADSAATLLDQLDSGLSSVGQAVMKREAVESLLQSIDLLPTAYREVVRRFDLLGQSARAIAGQMNCSEGAVYMRRTRAHQLLREWLEEVESKSR